MNCRHSPLVTGTRPIRNAGTSTTCAGRSLSSECGSVTASTPSTNSPPGTSTDVPATPGRPAGSRDARVQQRRAGPQVQRLQHGLVVLVLVADHQPEHEARVRRRRRAARRGCPAPWCARCRSTRGLRRAAAAAARPGWRANARTRRRGGRLRAAACRAGRGCRRAAATAPPAGRCGRGPRPAGSSTGRTGAAVRRRRSRRAAACVRAPGSARRASVSRDVTAHLAPVG